MNGPTRIGRSDRGESADGWAGMCHKQTLADRPSRADTCLVRGCERDIWAPLCFDHHRRRIIHFEVTQSPTQAWLARQITEAFPWDTVPRYLLRDRDTSYGQGFRDRVRIMGIERVIGSVRRECLDHVIIINERHLRRVLSSYFRYYHESRTHLSLDKDCPETRPILPPTAGKILAVAQLGGLHHQYERRAA